MLFEAGVIKQAPGLTSFLFVIPESWFVRLWGETEFSVRLPHMMGLALLYPVVTGLIRVARPMAVLRLVDHLLIAAALCLYSLSVIYSGGYHPWFGDSPMPAARETLAMVCFLGYILAFLVDANYKLNHIALNEFLKLTIFNILVVEEKVVGRILNETVAIVHT